MRTSSGYWQWWSHTIHTTTVILWMTLMKRDTLKRSEGERKCGEERVERERERRD